MAQLSLDFQQNRKHPQALAAMLARLARLDEAVWDIERANDEAIRRADRMRANGKAAEDAEGVKPLDDEERAMIAHAAAPHLDGGNRGSVVRRRELEK
jgi:hypothetical protein